MLKNGVLDLYLKTYKVGPALDTTLLPALKELSKIFGPLNRGLYPGSYIHVLPSLVIRDMTYVDPFHRCKSFFEEKKMLEQVLHEGRTYEEDPCVNYIQDDISNEKVLQSLKSSGHFDVLFSFSGPAQVSKTCGFLLREGGLLVVNDDFGDASLAMSASPDEWKLFGAIDQGGLISTKCEDLFVEMKSGSRASSSQLAANSGFSFTKRPTKLTQNPFAYVFQRRTPQQSSSFADQITK